MKLYLSLFLTFILCLGCSPSKNHTSVSKMHNPRQVNAQKAETSLLNIIRRAGGVTVRGSGENVSIRVFTGGNSLIGENRPLYLVNGNDHGYIQFAQVERSIDPSQVKSVIVYKTPAELARYGVRGANGAINIILKTN